MPRGSTERSGRLFCDRFSGCISGLEFDGVDWSSVLWETEIDLVIDSFCGLTRELAIAQLLPPCLER